jgi:Fe-S oxidoreductase
MINEVIAKDFSALKLHIPLKAELSIISGKCIRCKLCQKECAFLRKYGKPKDISDSYDPGNKVHQGMPFKCSLCQLCASVCPVKINPARMFLEMRRETVRKGKGDYPEHGVILRYEKRGTSERYSYYALPDGCDTIFFPGCALSGTRPDKVLKLYEHLKRTIPSLGIVLDCCTKPSHDLGREHFFQAMFHEMKDYLVRNGISNVVVACPSCYDIFNRYGDEVSVVTAYEYMSKNGLPDTKTVGGHITVHDSCAVRFEEKIHEAVRDIVQKKGLQIKEMNHSRKKTFCCGEGGSVGFLNPDLAKKWSALRKSETGGRKIIAYCAGCTHVLNPLTPTSHLADLLFEPEAALSSAVKVSKTPVTYLNRLRLKRYFKKTVKAPVTRERTFLVKGKKAKEW